MQSCLNWTSLYAHYPAPWLYQHLSSITTALIRLLTVPGTYHIYQQLQNTEGNRYLVSSSGNQWLLRQHLQCLSKKLSCTEHLVFHHSKYNNNRRGKPQSCLINGYRGLGCLGQVFGTSVLQEHHTSVGQCYWSHGKKDYTPLRITVSKSNNVISNTCSMGGSLR